AARLARTRHPGAGAARPGVRADLRTGARERAPLPATRLDGATGAPALPRAARRGDPPDAAGRARQKPEFAGAATCGGPVEYRSDARLTGQSAKGGARGSRRHTPARGISRPSAQLARTALLRSPRPRGTRRAAR